MTATEELKDHFYKELQSFKTPPAKEVAPLPKVGDPAPTYEKLTLSRDKPTIIVFLRHCGCPCKPAESPLFLAPFTPLIPHVFSWAGPTPTFANGRRPTICPLPQTASRLTPL